MGLYILLAGLGLVTHILVKLQGRVNKKKKFSCKYWLADNWIDVSLGIVSIVSIMLMRDELMSFLGIMQVDGSDNFMKLTSFMAGLFNTDLIRRLIKTVKKDEESA